jgi:uncharacterized protein (TIGR02996 family)
MSLLDDGFFHPIQQAPDDDAPRLVYADFLEERGDDLSAGRAELIRVQVELARCPPTSARAVELAARERELLDWGEQAWVGEWAAVLDGWTFRRGLVEAIRVDASVFLEYAADWFAEWPTLAVAKLTRAAGHLEELADCPWLAHLRGLDLSDCDIDGEGLAPLTFSRNIGLLQALDLSDNPIGPCGAELLSSSPTADDLREVHLGRCRLGGAGLERLLGGRPLPWTRLDLTDNGLDRPAVLRLADSATLANLRTLVVGGHPHGNYFACKLAESSQAAGLEDLGLAWTELGDAGLTALAEADRLPALRSLDIQRNHATYRVDRDGTEVGGLAALIRSPLLSRLRRLLVGHGNRTSHWVTATLGFACPTPRNPLVEGGWLADVLRKSPYLIPSRLDECDLEELWWLGDRVNRDRLPSAWRD